jgi:hypothetical protein
MIAAINRHPDQSQKFGFVWSYTGKFLIIRARYRKLYPDGLLLAPAQWCLLAGFILFVCWIWAFQGDFHRH